MKEILSGKGHARIIKCSVKTTSDLHTTPYLHHIVLHDYIQSKRRCHLLTFCYLKLEDYRRFSLFIPQGYTAHFSSLLQFAVKINLAYILSEKKYRYSIFSCFILLLKNLPIQIHILRETKACNEITSAHS